MYRYLNPETTESKLSSICMEILSNDYFVRINELNLVRELFIRILNLKKYLENKISSEIIKYDKFQFLFNVMFNLNIDINSSKIFFENENDAILEFEQILYSYDLIKNKYKIDSQKIDIKKELTTYNYKKQFPCLIPNQYKSNNNFKILSNKIVNAECQNKIIDDYKKGKMIFYKNANKHNLKFYITYMLSMFLGSIYTIGLIIIAALFLCNTPILVSINFLILSSTFIFFTIYGVWMLVKLRNKNNRVFIEQFYTYKDNFYKKRMPEFQNIFSFLIFEWILLLMIISNIITFFSTDIIYIKIIFIVISFIAILSYLISILLIKFKIQIFKIDMSVIQSAYGKYYYEISNEIRTIS